MKPLEFYYVSWVDGKRYGLLAGPYLFHDEALQRVEQVRKIAEQHDPRAFFMAFGTCKLTVNSDKIYIGTMTKKGLI